MFDVKQGPNSIILCIALHCILPFLFLCSFRMDGPVPNSKKEKPYPSPPEENFLTPLHTSRDGPHEMSSSERRQYNKALRAMYEIVRLGSKRLSKPSAADDDKSNDDEDDDDVIPETVTETSDNEENDGEYVSYLDWGT